MPKKLSELKATDEVVVTLGKKTSVANGKLVTIEEERNIVLTKAGYEAIEVDKDGHAKTLGRTIKLIGTPVYKDEENTLGGAHKELEKAEGLTKEKAETPAA
ncbi:hypothetical protein A6C57_23470 [Fibrella sp. ES10-3-2-2]|nr:hypothetical protein A6C57_23470 [Fibrella sp. ES10-3-2-2]